MGRVMKPGVTFGLLGHLEVRCKEVPIPVPLGKQRALLAILLIRAGQTIPAEELAELMWAPASPPTTAAVTVRNYVKRLRQALGPAGRDRIATKPGGYLIRVEPGELDSVAFEQALAAAQSAMREASWLQAAFHAAAALDLWRGEPLSDVNLPVLAAVEVPRLTELRMQAQELRIEADLRLARHAGVAAELQELAVTAPLREHVHALLMLALYRCGRRAEALAAYQNARSILVEELGIEPGPDLRALHRQILTDDPALAAPSAAAGDPKVTGALEAAPRQLPAAVGCFSGRDAELATLTGLLTAKPADGASAVLISAIGGTAGVGKSALAIKWAHQVAGEFPDGQLHVNLRGYDPGQPLAPGEALGGLLAALGVPGQQIPAEEAGRAAAYRSVLAGRRVLIVLDNARDPEQVRPRLPGTPGCLVLVTSRDTLAGLVARDGARRLLLDVLPLSDAMALLRALIGPRVDAEPEAAARLADLCCYLPLALRVAAELAAARPVLTLAALVGELDGQRRLDALEAGGDPSTAVRAVFSWSCRYLSPGAARAFRLAALHPGADFDSRAVAALTGSNHPAACRALAELTRACLLGRTGEDRYAMHDLLRAYAAELAAAQDPATGRREALTRLLDYYLHTARRAAGILFPAEAPAPADAPGGASAAAVTDEHAARTWLNAERENLTAVAAYASEHDWPGHAVGLSAALFRHLDGGSLADALVIHGAAARGATQAGDRAAEAGAVNNIGGVYLRLGRNWEAEQHFQRALRLSRETGDALGEIRALLNLGLIYLRTGAYPNATSNCQQALELSRATSDQIREARALLHLGLIAIRQGRYQQAAAGLVQAAEASRAVGDVAFLAVSLTHLSDVEVRQGRYRQARRHLEEARTTARQIGHAMAEADVTASLGFADLREGRDQEAGQHLQQAHAATHDAGVSDAEAQVLCWLGELDLRLGRPAQAVGRYQQALTIYRRITEPSGEAEARNGLGEAALAQGEPEEARAHHQAALAIARKIGGPEQQARAHERLGNLSAAAGDAAGARPHWQQALALYVHLETPEAERIRAKLAIPPG
jgi:DNA-binding SARP family transcriptional activator/tetratricopeptide (TPR) repeat protein